MRAWQPAASLAVAAALALWQHASDVQHSVALHASGSAASVTLRLCLHTTDGCAGRPLVLHHHATPVDPAWGALQSPLQRPAQPEHCALPTAAPQTHHWRPVSAPPGARSPAQHTKCMECQGCSLWRNATMVLDLGLPSACTLSGISAWGLELPCAAPGMLQHQAVELRLPEQPEGRSSSSSSAAPCLLVSALEAQLRDERGSISSSSSSAQHGFLVQGHSACEGLGPPPPAAAARIAIALQGPAVLHTVSSIGTASAGQVLALAASLHGLLSCAMMLGGWLLSLWRGAPAAAAPGAAAAPSHAPPTPQQQLAHAALARLRVRRELLNDRLEFDALGVALPPQLPLDAQGLPCLTLLLPGAAHSPLQGTLWRIQVCIPQDYPFAAPLLLLPRVLHHPLVAPGTQQWLPQRSWSPATTLLHLLLELQALLAAPQLEGGAVANALAASQYVQQPEAFFRQLREGSEPQL